MTLTNHIADIKLIGPAAYAFKTAWETSTTGIEDLIDAVVSGANADDNGAIAALLKDPRLLKKQVVAAFNAFTPAVTVKLQQFATELDRADVTANSPAKRILGIALREWMLANSHEFESRGVTNSAPSSISGTGNGTLVMLSTDEESYELEGVYAETLTFECTRGSESGATPGEETWSVYGEQRARHILESGGSGARTTITGSWASNTQALKNATFGSNTESDATFDASTSLTKLTSWTITGTATNVNSDSSNTFRTLSAGTSRSIELVASESFYQEYDYTGSNPVIVAVPVNKTVGTATGGNFDLNVGADTSATALSGLSSGWQWAYVTLWPSEMAGSTSRVTIGWSSASSGSLLIGPVVMRPMTYIGGKWFAMLPGATDFVEGDSATQQTTIAATGKFKHFLHLLYGTDFELPHDSSASSTPFEDWS